MIRIWHLESFGSLPLSRNIDLRSWRDRLETLNI
jgi:hypothetical protein